MTIYIISDYNEADYDNIEFFVHDAIFTVSDTFDLCKSDIDIVIDKNNNHSNDIIKALDTLEMSFNYKKAQLVPDIIACLGVTYKTEQIIKKLENAVKLILTYKFKEGVTV